MKLVLNYLALVTLALFCINCNNSKKAVTGKTDALINAPLSGIYWRLTELIGQPVTASADAHREAFIKFNPVEKSVGGNGGCNTFGGSYQLTGSSQISFGPIMSTKMYCEDAKYENLFFDILSKADNYFINGDTLFLRNAGMDSTAKFIADHLKK